MAMEGLLLYLLPLFFAGLNAEPQNITVDDQLGDPITGLVPEYIPDNVWNVGSTSEDCIDCHINRRILDSNQVYDKTWHDATPINSTIPTTVTVHFTGSAVYVFNILPNTLLKTVTFANITYSIDGTSPYTFTHVPDPNSESILYNQLVYQKTGLENEPHTLTMTVGHYSLILFDYLLYTQDNTTMSATANSAPTNVTQSPPPQFSTPGPTSASTPVSAIAGATVGGVILLFGAALGAFLLGRRRTLSKPATRKSQPDGPSNTRFLTLLPVEPDATPLSDPPGDSESDPVARWVDDAETHNLPDLASNASGQVAFTPRDSNPLNIVAHSDGISTQAEWSSSRRAELTRRLQTLRDTRRGLSSGQPLPGCSQSEFNRLNGVEAAIRELEREIAQLRPVLAILNLRLADNGHEGHVEPLPQYAE